MNCVHLIVADANLPALDTLFAHLPAGTQVQLVHDHCNVLEQIAQATRGHRHLQSLHILGHGEPGRMLLGNQWVDAKAIEAHPQHMACIAGSLTDDAHIWLYGCHSAAGTVGEQWLDAWALATGAVVHGTDSHWGLHEIQLDVTVGSRSVRDTAVTGSLPLINPLYIAWQKTEWAYRLALRPPVLDASKSPTLGNATNNKAAPVNGSTLGSVLVSALVNTNSLNNFSDADGGQPGMAITGVNANGTLWYTTNGGVAWSQLAGTVSSNSALTLYANADTRVYFQPNAGFGGNLNNAITFHAWDRSGGFVNGQSGVSITGTSALNSHIDINPNQNNYPRFSVIGDKVYILSQYYNHRYFSTYDISDLSTPVLVNEIEAGIDTWGNMVFNGNYAYIVELGGGFRIIDIRNSPPKQIYYNERISGGDVEIAGDYAYIAHNYGGVKVLDIRDPSNVKSLGSTFTSGAGYGIEVSGNLAYVADENAGLQIIDISNPLLPTVLGTYKTIGDALDIEIKGNYVYIAGGYGGLQIIDVSDPTSPTLVGTVPSVVDNFTWSSHVITLSGEMAYVAAGPNLFQVDISTPEAPKIVKIDTKTDYIRDVEILGNTIYTISHWGLDILGQKSNAIFFSSASDTISANILPSGHVFIGTSANDTFTTTAGSDTIDGAGGIDTVVFTGTRADHTLTRTTPGWTISSATDGSDTLQNVERLQFSDMVLALDINGNAGQAYRIYQAAFNRTPDKGGLSYWVGRMDSGTSLDRVAAEFIGSQEFQMQYGSNPSNANFLTTLYQNILKRAPDQGGYDWWLGQLNSGQVTKVSVLAGFSESAENQQGVIGVIQNGIELIV